MNTQQNQSQHKNEQGKQNLKQPQGGTGTKQTQAKPAEKAQSPTQKQK
jgi:hypothetical protein